MSPSKKILFIVTGSIAAYKAMTLVSRLIQRGYDLECVLTQSAQKFIGRATIEGLTGKAAHTDLYDADNIMAHIHLIRDADAVIVAPATASFINKLASGIADDLASTLFLAHDFKKPFVLAPAMNTKMYEHPQTQASLKRLKEIGVSTLEAGSGILACGEVGYGKLLEPEILLAEIEKILGTQPTQTDQPKTSPRVGPKILVTGGGTIEKIDDVRSLTNTSSGETAIAIANYFYDLGVPVTLVINNQKNLPIPTELQTIAFTSFSELNATLKKQLSSTRYDYIIHAAAVSDFSLSKIEGLGAKRKTNSQTANKISSNKTIKLVLKPNFKIISKLALYSKNKNIGIIGFKLTSKANDTEANVAVKKVFANRNVNYVVHNDLAHIDRQKGIHRFSLFHKKSAQTQCIESREHLLTTLAQLILENGENI